MAANLYTHQDQNIAKTWALMSTFLVIVILLGWVISLYYQSTIILYIAVIIAVLTNIFSYWNSDKIVLKITGAKPANREDNFDLYTIVENLAITAGLPMPKVYIINDPVPNAFATGRDKEHAVVAVSSGLLQTLNKVELEGVIAHELAHIGNRDILLQTIVVILVGFITLLADIFLRTSLHGGSDNSKGNMIFLVIGIVLAILSPLAATAMQLAISRKREFLADATGALLTRYPEGLASALEKISGYSAAHPKQKMQKANHATAHLFISSPFSGKKRGGLRKLFSTHPPMEERVVALRGMEVK